MRDRGNVMAQDLPYYSSGIIRQLLRNTHHEEEGRVMAEHDVELARRVRDVVAVVADDIDAVSFDVEDGVAYIEGVVPTDEQRRAISNAVSQINGLDRVVTCLATEHVLPATADTGNGTLYPTQLYMHYYSS